MPKKRNTRPRYSRRRHYRKKQFSKPVINTLQHKLPRGSMSKYIDINPLPPTMYTKFVYNASDIISSGSSGSTLVATAYEFLLNGLQDPYVGVTGQYNVSCAGYGQLLSSTGPYQRYKVNGVLIEIEAYDPDGADSDASELCVQLLNNTNFGAAVTIVGLSAQNIESTPRGFVKRISGSGSQRRYIKQYVPMWALMEMTKEQFRTERSATTADYAGLPSKKVSMQIGLANRRGPSTATTLCVKVRLTYHVELFDRILTGGG